MSRKLFYIFSAVAVLLFMGCTLYMDEAPEIPEAERGFGEAYTEKNDSVEVTYKFYDDVRSFTENMANEYVALVEGDSVVYLSESTPNELVPSVNNKLFIMPCKATPYGVMGKVMDVRNTDGFIRVEVIDAGIDEVFDELDIKANVKAISSNDFVTTDTLTSDDPAYIDPCFNSSIPAGLKDENLVEVDDDGNVIGGAESRLTRAPDDDEDKPEDWEGDSWHEPVPGMDDEWDIDTRNLVGKVPANGTVIDLIDTYISGMGSAKSAIAKGVPPKFAKGILGFYKGADEVLKIAKPYLTGDRYFRLHCKRTSEVEVFWEFSRKKQYYKLTEDCKETTDYLLEAGYKYKDKYYTKLIPGLSKEILGEAGLNIKIPLGMGSSQELCKIWGPFILVGRISGSFDVKADLIGQMRYVKETHKITGEEYKNGVSIPIEKDGDVQTKTSKEEDFMGQASASVSFDCSLGVGVGKKGANVNLSLGRNIEFGFRVRCGDEVCEISDVREQNLDEENNFWGPFLTIRIYLEGGIELTDWFTPNDRTTLAEWHPVDKRWPIYPKVNTAATTARVNARDATLTMKFKDLGDRVSHGDKLPTFMRVYTKNGKKVGDYYSGMMNMVAEIVDRSTDKVYTYQVKGLEDDVLYYAVPCVSRVENNYTVTYMYNKNPYYFASTTPSAYLIGAERSVWGYDSYGQYVNTGKTRHSEPVELVDAKAIGITLMGSEFYIGVNAGIIGIAKCSSWGITVRFHTPGVKDFVKDCKISGKTSEYYRILVKNRSQKRATATVTVTPYCYIIQPNGKAEKYQYDDEAVSIDVDNMMEGTHDYSYDNGNMFVM